MELDRNQVVNAIGEIQAAEIKDINWGKGEYRNAVFERLMHNLGLPWKETELGAIPDFDDPGVKELNRLLDNFSDLLLQRFK